MWSSSTFIVSITRWQMVSRKRPYSWIWAMEFLLSIWMGQSSMMAILIYFSLVVSFISALLTPAVNDSICYVLEISLPACFAQDSMHLMITLDIRFLTWVYLGMMRKVCVDQTFVFCLLIWCCISHVMYHCCLNSLHAMHGDWCKRCLLILFE